MDMNYDIDTYVENMDKLRRGLGLSVVEFCDHIGVKAFTYYSWIGRNRKPGLWLAVNVLNTFKVDLSVLANKKNGDDVILRIAETIKERGIV